MDFNHDCISFHSLLRMKREGEEHLRHCDDLDKAGTQAERAELSKSFRINYRSCFLELDHFDLCSGALLPDPMHDLLEGVLQYEAKLILNYSIMQEKYLSFSRFCDLLESIELGYMEVDDRPTPITRSLLTGPEKNLSQKG